MYLYDKGKRRRTYYRKLDNPHMVAHVAPFPGHFNETSDFVSKIVHGQEIAPTKEIRKMKFEGKWKIPKEKRGQYQELISLYPKLGSSAAWCKEKEM